MIITSDGIRNGMGRREFVGCAVGAFMVAAIPLARRRPARVVRRSAPVMGTIAHFAVVDRDERRAHAAIDCAIRELEWVERTMTRFRTTSDVGRANVQAAGEAVSVSAETALVTEEALRWAAVLDGRYDPAAGAISLLWDVNRRREPPAESQVSELASRAFHRAVEVGRRGATHVLRYTDRGVRLDLGSIAKGYGVDRAVDALRSRSVANAVVVAGGDLYAIGSAPDGEPWRIGIQSPTEEHGIDEVLQLSDRAVATSGTYRQFFEYRGRTYHHIMDPATARPRETTMRSLSIMGDSVMQVDAATTALFGMAAHDIDGLLARQLPGARVARIING
jgi:thiamine biosynthesis lipoprotein